jgi:hypothetical protein
MECYIVFEVVVKIIFFDENVAEKEKELYLCNQLVADTE